MNGMNVSHRVTGPSLITPEVAFIALLPSPPTPEGAYERIYPDE